MTIRKGSINYWILLSLETIVENIADIENFTYSAQIKALKGIPLRPSKKTLSQSIRRLRMNGMIEYDKKSEGQIILKLTNFGQEILDSKKETVSDGKYRIVIWDIPESKRTIRNLLRRRLKEWGFKSCQKSVWVSQKNVTQQLRRLITDLGLEKWVAVIESDDSSLESIFRV